MNMLRTSLLALLLIALVAPSLSLKCYTCLDCDNHTPIETDCAAILFTDPTCMKINGKVLGKDVTSESCFDKILCQAAAKKNSDAAMTYCCDTDLCNGTPAPSPAPAPSTPSTAPASLAGLGLLLVPALAYFAA